MTWSYSGNPTTSAQDAVRYWSGQTDKCNQTISNEEILYVLSLQPDVKLAAADVLDSLAAKWAGVTDERVGDVQRSGSKITDAYRKRAEELRREAGGLTAEFFAGGLSIAGKESLNENTDAVQPSFRIGMDDHPDLPNERDEDTDYRGGCP